MNKLLTLSAVLMSCSLFGAGYPSGTPGTLPGQQNGQGAMQQSRDAAAQTYSNSNQAQMNNPNRSNSTVNGATNSDIRMNGATGTNTPSMDPRSPAINQEVETQMKHAQNNGRPTQDIGTTFKDNEINKKIRAKISGWYVEDYKLITLNTNNGIVTIAGFVEKPEISKDLADQVKKIDGVREVNNNVKANNPK